MGKYQNVGVPAFYVDHLQYLSIIGNLNLVESDSQISVNEMQKLFYLDPTKKIDITNKKLFFSLFTQIEDVNVSKFNYCAILGHNVLDDRKFEINFFGDSIASELNNDIADGINTIQEYTGFSLFEFDLTDIYQWNGNNNSSTERFSFTCDLGVNEDQTPKYLNSVSMGTKYVMPHSPDLDLTMTREFGNATKQYTKGGALLTNYDYTQPPIWGDNEPWGLNTQDSNVNLRRAGRRMWNLKFSYISDSDLMPDTELLTINPNEQNNNPDNYNNVLTANNFFSSFMHRTLGGSLRFIFQPDSNDNNPDGFAICVLDQDSISIKQITYNTYNINLRIMEVW